MSVATQNKMGERVIGASVFVPVSGWRLYEAVRDVQNFPSWAPGVRRVEVLEGPAGPGMISEWEVSFLGLKRRLLSVLEEDEPAAFLRWTYEGPITGWGECVIKSSGYGTLAEFRTVLSPVDPRLQRLMRSAFVRDAAYGHLKRSLAQLGRLVSGGGGRVVVGPSTNLARREELLPRVAV
jgi:Polyketide cyclase / dehydrase and lipid transport